MMPTDSFKVMLVDLDKSRGSMVEFGKKSELIGGSGLAAALFLKYADPDLSWDDPSQPLIFTVGPLTGMFPLMSKTVCAFKSPYHNQYAESHAGGRSAMSLRLTGLDALIITGRAKRLTCLTVGPNTLDFADVEFMRGQDIFAVGKLIRRLKGASGQRSILRIGPAGENKVAYSCINADTYRHFGRLGSGAVMGSKNLKALVLRGEGHLDLPGGADYKKLFKEIYRQVTATNMMSKYHNLGTAGNILTLNEIKALPWRNLQASTDADAEGISGEVFARDTLLRNVACTGCPVGCVHVGFVRELFSDENDYLYRQVSYDFEPIFAIGSMLGIKNAFDVLRLLDAVEKTGLDVMSAGVALAWATEALEKGVISTRETLEPFSFGGLEAYEKAMGYLANAENDFYRLLGRGTMKAAEHYGGADYACVLGQEMAGYATGPTFYVAQGLGLRHSHLDTGGYSLDQSGKDLTVKETVDFLIRDEKERVMLTSLVSCLFARGVYKQDIIRQALESVGLNDVSENLAHSMDLATRLRWQARLITGYRPHEVKIPKRYLEVENWKGKADPEFLEQLRLAYADYIVSLKSPD